MMTTRPGATWLRRADLDAMLGGLNKALADAGRPERFADLCSGGQEACVIVGTAEGLADLVETLGLPLEHDANTAVAIGIAAEDHAAAQIQAENPSMKITRGWTPPGTYIVRQPLGKDGHKLHEIVESSPRPPHCRRSRRSPVHHQRQFVSRVHRTR
jgi:hypothetical protein